MQAVVTLKDGGMLVREHKGKILGTHACFYYYGSDHLMINMYNFIMEGIAKNEAVYVSMECDLYEALLALLRKKDICTEGISFVSAKAFITIHQESGLFGLKQMVQSLTLAAGDKDYKGIRWILQPTCAIRETSKQDFLSLESDLTKALKGTDAALICVYDFYDYMNQQKMMDEEIISFSEKTHGYRLYCNKYMKL